jgi:myo-inositol-1(or 4)-monophosphatase
MAFKRVEEPQIPQPVVNVVNENKLLRVAVEGAERAGKLLLKSFEGSNLSVRAKHDYPGSLVTNADIEAEKIILRSIRKSRIKSTVSSEEAGLLNFGSRDLVWAVDPLDGTLNYAKRIPYFAVSIGILLRRKTIGGVIYNPVLDELFTATRDHGAYMNGKRIHVSAAKSLTNSSLIFEWWNPEPRIPDPLGFEKKLYRFTRRLRSPGSVALNLCSVASGRFDGLVTAYRRAPLHEVSAGCLIAQEAGAVVTNSTGESWETYSNSSIVGNKSIHKGLVALLHRQR